MHSHQHDKLPNKAARRRQCAREPKQRASDPAAESSNRPDSDPRQRFESDGAVQVEHTLLSLPLLAVPPPRAPLHCLYSRSVTARTRPSWKSNSSGRPAPVRRLSLRGHCLPQPVRRLSGSLAHCLPQRVHCGFTACHGLCMHPPGPPKHQASSGTGSLQRLMPFLVLPPPFCQPPDPKTPYLSFPLLPPLPAPNTQTNQPTPGCVALTWRSGAAQASGRHWSSLRSSGACIAFHAANMDCAPILRP